MSVQEEIERRARAAREAVPRAGELALRYFTEGVSAELKADQTPVTIADKETEELLRDILHTSFPEDGFLGEEYGAEEGTSGFRWIIDPIDGTYNFMRGIPIFATLVALEHEEELIAGFCAAPALGTFHRAVRGGGAFRNDRPIRVSTIDRLRDAQVIYSSADWYERSGNLDFFTEMATEAKRTRGFGDFYGFTLVAEGAAEAMLEPLANPWDLAALLPILEEAGGIFTDWNGERTAFGSGAIVGNPPLHAELLARYRRKR